MKSDKCLTTKLVGTLQGCGVNVPVSRALKSIADAYVHLCALFLKTMRERSRRRDRTVAPYPSPYIRYPRRVNDLMAKVLADVPLPAGSAGAGKAKKSKKKSKKKAADKEPTAASADAAATDAKTES